MAVSDHGRSAQVNCGPVTSPMGMNLERNEDDPERKQWASPPYHADRNVHKSIVRQGIALLGPGSILQMTKDKIDMTEEDISCLHIEGYLTYRIQAYRPKSVRATVGEREDCNSKSYRPSTKSSERNKIYNQFLQTIQRKNRIPQSGLIVHTLAWVDTMTIF